MKLVKSPPPLPLHQQNLHGHTRNGVNCGRFVEKILEKEYGRYQHKATTFYNMIHRMLTLPHILGRRGEGRNQIFLRCLQSDQFIRSLMNKPEKTFQFLTLTKLIPDRTIASEFNQIALSLKRWFQHRHYGTACSKVS